MSHGPLLDGRPVVVNHSHVVISSCCLFPAPGHKMIRKMQIIIAVLVLAGIVAADEPRKEQEFFEKRIRPVLIRHCYECHSAASSKSKGGLRVDSRDLIRRGGESGPAVVPGKPAESLILDAMRHESLEMPPEKKLPERVIRDFELWIENGAHDPRDAPPTADQIAEVSWNTVLQERRNWWSLQPVRPTEAPVFRGRSVHRPIDAFVQAHLQKQQIRAAGSATPRTLARRAAFVLTGLPPDTDEVDEFVRRYQVDPDAAWGAWVDRLLSSPHFGEHWARHWMDVVRFAETHGYEWNHEIRGAWRYRDYLIRAFNGDVPYDQLIREHIAGDLLESPRTNAELELNESLIGTAFWRFGELGHDDCVDFPAIRFDALDNQIDTFSKSFQGLTVSCARCHDHKIDAISTKDYYALVGMLESCSQVVHTLDSPERIRDIETSISETKKRVRKAIGKDWIDSAAELNVRIADALRGRGNTALQTHLNGNPDWSDPGFILKQLLQTGGNAAFRDAKWVWTQAGAATEEPETAPRCFRFGFEVTEIPRHAILHVTADDRVTAWINGKPLGTNTQWTIPAQFDLQPHLRTGRNTLALTAENETGPAGLIAAIELTGRIYATNKAWLCSTEHLEGWQAVDFDDSSWSAATELGPASMLPWNLQISSPVNIQKRWSELSDQYTAEQQRRAEHNRKFKPWADFRGGNAAGWTATGLGLIHGWSRPGEFTLTSEGDTVIAVVLPAGLYTNRTSSRLNASLRSPWVPTDHRYVSLQIVGDGRSMIRPVVDSCGLNEFAGGGLEYLAGAAKWKLFPTSAGGFHRSFVELTTKSDNPRWPDRPGRAGTNDPKELESPHSSFGLVRAVLHDTPSVPLPGLKPLMSLFEHRDLSTAAQVAEVYQKRALQAVRQWHHDRADDEDVRWIQWLLATGLIPNSAAESEELRSLISEFRSAESQLPTPRVVAGLANQGPGRGFPVLKGGDPDSRMTEVSPRYLEVLSGRSAFGTGGSGRRQLAEIVASPQNPLTARVMVNRVWHHLFGRGIVTTPDDFGGMGAPPTHPMLLDYLAGEFIRNDWSIKRLIRRIVMTETFRRSSQPEQQSDIIDPANRFLHCYPARRLTAESIRDTILTVSGRLDRTLFGPGIHPHRKEETDYRKLWIGPLDGTGRRSLYIKVTRMEGPRFLELFDFPIPMATQGRRDITNVPTQALALLNDPFVINQAEYWGSRLVERQDATVSQRVQHMFRMAVGRLPTAEEQTRFVEFLRELVDEQSEKSLLTNKLVWEDAAHAMFNLKELIYIP